MSHAGTSKADLRAQALARRSGIPADDHQRLSRLAAGRIAPLIADAETLALFWPIRGEIDPRSLCETVRAHSGCIVLPAVVGDDIVFRRFENAGNLEAGSFGTRHPPADAPQCLPDLIVAPLAAFDRAGGRIGYGGGYYDRYISQLRSLGHQFRFIGIAFACQEVDAVPQATHDERLDAVATEREWIIINTEAAKIRP
jgi:5-formyltetrahydrofolate cyclo-ligase